MPGTERKRSLLPSQMVKPLLVLSLTGACVFVMVILVLPDIKFSATFIKSASRERDIKTESTVVGRRRHMAAKLASVQKILQQMAEAEFDDLAVDHRRRLAATLASVQRELQRIAGREAVIDAKWSLKLAEVVAELDPRTNTELESTNWDHSARLPDMGPAPQLPNRKRHVCPEIYDNSGDDYWTFMRPENCTYVPEFKDVITVLLPAYEWIPGTANFVVQQIRKAYDIPIIVIVSPDDKIDDSMDRVTLIKHDKVEGEAVLLNNVGKTVKTPYVFIGLSLTHFDIQSSLERLVRVLDELEHVKVVGGASRDNQGRWIHGCLQVRMAYYQAYFASGYYYSKYECMYCDDLLSSFVTSKKLFMDIPLTAGLHGPALYRDWFAKVREQGHLAMACPDVMFYVDKHIPMERDDWLMFGKQWVLESIYSYDKKAYNFSCDAVGISCDNPLDILRSYLLPHCCLDIVEKYTALLVEYGNKNNLDYELKGGSALGALKMGRFLPWDFDVDFLYHCKDYNNWLKTDKAINVSQCYNAVNREGVYFTLNCPYFFLEFFCYDRLSREDELPTEYKNTSTTISYTGLDIKVVANPGRHCRNELGFEILKHAAHWRTIVSSDVGKAKGGYDYPGSWNKCKNPKHHSCLDHFPGDGNLPFLEPFLLL